MARTNSSFKKSIKNNMGMNISGNEFINYFEKYNGIYYINPKQYIILADSTDIYKSAKGWIIATPTSLQDITAPRKECLLKLYGYENDCDGHTKTDMQMLKANNYILSEIAKDFKLEAADYARFIINDGMDGELAREENFEKITSNGIQYRLQPNKEYILTPSFLKKDESLIKFGDIISDNMENNVTVIWKQLEKFLISRNIPKNDISAIRKQYALKSLFGAFVELNDNHNYNDGLVLTENRTNRSARLAPAFDMDYAMGIYHLSRVGGPITFIKSASNGGFEFSDMLKEFEKDLTKQDLEELMINIHPDKLATTILEVDKQHKLELADNVITRYIQFFCNKYKEMENFYEHKYNKDIESKENNY